VLHAGSPQVMYHLSAPASDATPPPSFVAALPASVAVGFVPQAPAAKTKANTNLMAVT
jgi:hypothetical protein